MTDPLHQLFAATAVAPFAHDDIERDIRAAGARANTPAAHDALRELLDEAHEALGLIASGRDRHSTRDVEVAVRQRIVAIERNCR